MADPIREALKRLLDYVQAREAARAALAAEPPAPAPAADPLQGFAADLIASQRPMDPDVAAALTPEARWEMYDGEPAPAADGEREAPADHVPGAGNMVPADGKREELARLLDDDGRHLVEVALARECHKTWELACRVIRAAALLRQQPIEGVLTVTEHEELLGWGLIPVTYDAGGGVSIKRIIAEDGDWSVRNSRHVSPITGFPTAAAAWAALQQARRQEVGDA